MFKLLIFVIAFTYVIFAEHGPPDYPYTWLTPGLAIYNADEFCQSGWSSKHRNVPNSLKLNIYQEYNVTNYHGYCICLEGCEIDHLIPLELGGSNNMSNLWPQPFCGNWNAYLKDKLETKLHILVCNGSLNYLDAQHMIATDWIATYKKYF